MAAPPQPRHPVPDHIPEQLHEAFATTKGRTPPAHSPYQSGAAVQLHGFAGEMPGHRRTGFRGWVAACIGATILTGITTEGEEWAEYWGRLQPDGLPINLARWCTCCREERRALLSAHRAKHGEQLDMFELGAP